MALPDEQEIHRINLLDQDENSIFDISDMKGVITNVDPQDISKENFAELKNLRPYHGRLIETKAWGNKITVASGQTFDNLFTFIHTQFTGNGLTFELYVGIFVDNSTNVAHIYGYDDGSAAWIPLEFLTDVDAVEMVEGTDIDFDDEATGPVDRINQTAAKFVDENFAVGDYVSVTGSTSNDGVYGPVTIVAAGRLTFASGTLPGGDEAAGDKVIIRRYGFYHDNAKNPIFIHNHNLRALPGAVGLADGTNESKGIWVGYIDRDYFDGAWSPTGAFYLRPTNADAPLFTGDLKLYACDNFEGSNFDILNVYLYKFTYIYDGNQESLLSETTMRFEPAANQFPYLPIVDANFDEASWNKRITAIKVYRSTLVKSTNLASDYTNIMTVDIGRKSSDIIRDANITGTTIEFVDGGGGADTIRDSDNGFVTAGFVAGGYITVDGSSSNDGTYKLVSVAVGTLTLLTGTLTTEGVGATVIIEAGGLYDGLQACYVPDATSYTFATDTNYQITIDTGGTADIIQINNPQAIGSGNGYDVFVFTSEERTEDTWSSTMGWTIAELGGGGTNLSGTGIYCGEQSFIINKELTENEYVRGIITEYPLFTVNVKSIDRNIGKAVHFDKAIVNVTGTTIEFVDGGGGADTIGDSDNGFVTAGFVALDTITVEGSSLNDGEYIIVSVAPGTLTLATGTVTGEGAGAETRIGLKNTILSTNDTSWQILKLGTGLFFFDPGTSTYLLYIFDNGFPDGSPHPLTYDNITEANDLPMPTSIKVNGKFAKIMVGRLFQGNIVLDPGGVNEAHEDWLSYSELGQPDVTPVSNVIRIDDREGGPITGVAEIFGNPVVLKEQSLITINIKDNPTKPALWHKIESIHNIGNVAPNGYINVMNDLYVVSADGVYRLSPNNLAETDRTPTENLRITEPIQDVFDAAGGNHAATLSSYDQSKQEIVFYFGTIDAVDQLWRYNVKTGDWRQDVSGNTPTIFAIAENATIMMYGADKKVYTSSSEESSTTISLTTKTFHTGYQRTHFVREVSVRYKSDAAMTMEMYSNVELGAGLLHDGSSYIITNNSGGANFTDNGASNNSVGTAFTVNVGGGNSTTVTNWGTGKLRETSALYIGDGSANTVTLPVHPILANKKVTLKRYVESFYLKIFTS